MNARALRLGLGIALFSVIFASGWLLGNFGRTAASESGSTFPLSDFKCYVLEKGQPPGVVINILTQFGLETNVRIGHPSLLCAPAVKVKSPEPGTEYKDILEGPHLKCYSIGGRSVNVEVDLVPLQEEFPREVNLRVNAPRYFCIPVQKQVRDGSGGGTPGRPPTRTPTPSRP